MILHINCNWRRLCCSLNMWQTYTLHSHLLPCICPAFYVHIALVWQTAAELIYKCEDICLANVPCQSIKTPQQQSDMRNISYSGGQPVKWASTCYSRTNQITKTHSAFNCLWEGRQTSIKLEYNDFLGMSIRHYVLFFCLCKVQVHGRNYNINTWCALPGWNNELQILQDWSASRIRLLVFIFRPRG